MSHILIVEDEAIIRSALRRLLEHNAYQVSEAGAVDEAVAQFDLSQFDLIISDLRLPGQPGTELIKLARSTPVLIMTSYASLRSAVDSMKLGAVDYIAKPFDHDEMLAAVRHILSAHAKEAVKQPAITEAGRKSIADIREIMYGECLEMRKLFDLISKVAPTPTTVMIQGESGTGKELAARALHALSPRKDGPLICVNCAAIPESLIESELFGHEKGAFTGAVTARNGLIEAADGGTLFLDEIGELPLEAQARLLRVLQESEIRRVGSTQSRKVDIRLVTATHRNLRAMSKVGEFREDLFYRLNVMQLNIPPLRDRGEDIVGLAHLLLNRLSKQMDKHDLQFSPQALELIRKHRWPGNVRELENAIERAVILSDGDVITPDLLGIETETDEYDIPEGLSSREHAASSKQNEKTKALSLEDYFQHFVLENQDKMSETELARKLGISRKSLWERRQRLGIPRRK